MFEKRRVNQTMCGSRPCKNTYSNLVRVKKPAVTKEYKFHNVLSNFIETNPTRNGEINGHPFYC